MSSGSSIPSSSRRLIEQRHPSYPGGKTCANSCKSRSIAACRAPPRVQRGTRRHAGRSATGAVRAGTEAGPPLEVLTRPLDYRTGQPREKGIDVLLALDLAFGAANRDFDIVVLFSGDSDLLPALERAHARRVWRARPLPGPEEAGDSRGRTTSSGSIAFSALTTTKSTTRSTIAGSSPPWLHCA